MAGVEAVIHDSAMTWDLQQDCVDCAAYALRELNLTDQNKIAEFIKSEMDSKYGLLWYCVCGHSFGSLVGHEGGDCIYFSIDDIF
ncbi:dynein light chain LC8-type, partial [Strigomonas culicis]